MNGVFAGLSFAILTTFHGLWAHAFFIKVYNVDEATASDYASIILLGAMIGFIFYGWFVNKVVHSKYILIYSSIINTIILTIIFGVQGVPSHILIVLIFLCGFLSISYVLCYSIAYKIAPDGSKSMSVGFIKTLAVISAPILQFFIGLIIEYLVGNKLSDEISAYRLALAIFPILILLCAIIGCFLPNVSNKKV